jgi:hypothetical protein
MAESIALQGFSFDEWNAHREEVIARVMWLSFSAKGKKNQWSQR